MTILTAFCEHLIEFLDDIIDVFPNDLDIKASRKIVHNLRKVNPRSLIINWKLYITDVYKNEIYKNNIDFFIHKDYNKDVSDTEDSKYILDVIERLRNPIKNLTEENKKKTIKYIVNLTKLSELYTS